MIQINSRDWPTQTQYTQPSYILHWVWAPAKTIEENNSLTLNSVTIYLMAWWCRSLLNLCLRAAYNWISVQLESFPTAMLQPDSVSPKRPIEGEGREENTGQLLDEEVERCAVCALTVKIKLRGIVAGLSATSVRAGTTYTASQRTTRPQTWTILTSATSTGRAIRVTEPLCLLCTP